MLSSKFLLLGFNQSFNLFKSDWVGDDEWISTNTWMFTDCTVFDILPPCHPCCDKITMKSLLLLSYNKKETKNKTLKMTPPWHIHHVPHTQHNDWYNCIVLDWTFYYTETRLLLSPLSSGGTHPEAPHARTAVINRPNSDERASIANRSIASVSSWNKYYCGHTLIIIK